MAFDETAGEAYVADGSRNHRVAVVDMNTGTIKRFWGAYGKQPDDAAPPAYSAGAMPQQFRSVRCVHIANDGTVYVCDRGNDRLQVFKKDGSFLKEKAVAPNTLGEGSVWDVAFSRDPVAASKVVVAYARENQKLVILGGIVAGTAVDASGVKALAELPSLDELRGKIIGLINAPATKLAGLLAAPGGQLARVIGAYSRKEAA